MANPLKKCPKAVRVIASNSLGFTGGRGFSIGVASHSYWSSPASSYRNSANCR